ncbi:MAG: hypothetical protein OXT07_16445 [bacterium]|nr:hypothetical protein [bacterium]MDE0216809.1 hypothetical protein [bacterium]
MTVTRQQTGALTILFVLLAALAIVVVLLAFIVVPDTANMVRSIRSVN